ncbi:MAG: Xaa-Pro peptidase family protein [Nitrososphaeria archaeon]|nr:Xaa-Pro peptidase family protein [Nitrososphaeria archaeon]
MISQILVRRKKILLKAEELGFKQVLVTGVENIYYFTGFWGGGYLLLTQDGARLFTGLLEKNRASEYSFETEVVSAPLGESSFSLLKDYVRTRVLVDEIPFSLKERLEKSLNVGLVVEPKIFYDVRKVKDEYEVRLLKEASKRIDMLYDLSTKIIKEGVSEREVASRIVGEAIGLGLDTPYVNTDFTPIIVASGPNSSLPHAQVTERRFRRGDVIKLDFFFRYGGYVSDETRTFILGRASSEFKNVYDAVLFAQEKGIKAVRVGVKAGDVDSMCRKFIGEKGYLEYFTHGTGHGVGLEVHEPPTLSVNQSELLELGNVVTVEPGVYIPKKFGVRIEDTVYVGENVECLTHFTKELIEL